MAKYKAAGQEATFTVKVKQVKPSSSYKIEICQAGGSTSSVLKTLTGTWEDSSSEKDGCPIEIDGATATIRWKAEGPPADADQRSWRVFAQVTVTDEKGKEKKQPSQELEVYNDFVEVEAVRDDGSAIKDAAFKLLVAKKVHAKDKTAETGKVKLTEVPGGPVKVEWERPYALEKWVTQKGTAVKAQLTVAKKASIVSPKGTKKKPHKQHVNLPADPKIPQNGTKVTVKLKLEGGVKGDKIYVRQSFGAANSKRNDVVRGLSAPQTTAWAKEGGITVTLGDKAPEASFEVELGKAGGDLIILEAGGTDQFKDNATVYLQNWRKLWYQISVPKGTDPPGMQRLVKCMADAFVEYEEVAKDRAKIEETDAGMPAGSWFDAKHVGGKAGDRYLNVGSSNRDWFHTKYFKKSKAPHQCHVLYAHAQMDAKADDTKPLLVEAAKAKEFDWPAGGKAWGGAIKFANNVFPMDLKTGASALKSGKWEEVGGARKGNLTDADLFYFFPTKPAYPEYVAFKLPADGVQALKDGKDVKVTLTVATMAGTYLGEAMYDSVKKVTTGKQLIATHAQDKGARTANSTVNDVMAHELGHTLAQVVEAGKEPPGLKHADHKRQYTGMDHSGSHCADGLKDAKFGDGKGSGLKSFAGQAKCKCIMYGENNQAGSGSNGKFCARCKPYLKAQTAESIP